MKVSEGNGSIGVLKHDPKDIGKPMSGCDDCELDRRRPLMANTAI